MNKHGMNKERVDKPNTMNIHEKESLDAQSQWEAELVRRIDQIEETAGAVQTMTKKDYVVAGVVTLLCLLFVVVGAFIH